jgi:D-alanyl-D-alanine dipeptidase
MPFSGPQWAKQFPTTSSTDALVEPFRGSVNRFLGALRAAGATVDIHDTLRPPERAYLMHYSFRIARQALDPSTVPAMAGVDIQWVHTDGQGAPDLPASKAAAEQMVGAYGIVFRPALTSRHTEGRAIDMTISWQGDLTIATAVGGQTTITTEPRTGAGNAALHGVGAAYGVCKLVTDAPHWSSDGH